MKFIRYAVGFIAGFIDNFGTVEARHKVLSVVDYNADVMNGFDAAYDLVIYHISPWWRRFHREQKRRFK